MRPTGDRIFVKPLPHAELTGSGLIIPEAAKGRPTKGEVLMIGDAVDDNGEPIIRCKPGDHVLFPDQAGTDFEYHDVEMKVLRWGDVQAILDPPELKSAEQIMSEGGYPYELEVVDVLNEGTIKAKLVISLNGHQFYLQGNCLEPVPLDKKEIPPIQA